ncbi:MAG: carboxypeptidase regulatory-like domain-containing protein [Actinobacteria bacterium]|nr:carboxypeptidase regulatory-like domain-containing protein [Actinomycetota bacterium]
MVVTHSARISLATPLIVVVLSVLGWLFLALPSGAEEVPTGSVRFEIVDAVTGEPLEASVENDMGLLLASGADPYLLTDVAVGERTYYVSFGRYGNTPGRVGHPGSTVLAEVFEDQETFVRVEMLPPGTVRFKAVTEVTGERLTHVNAWAYTRLIGQIGDPLVAVEGWFEIDVFPAPVESVMVIFDQSSFQLYDLPVVESGEVVSMLEPLMVPDVPSVRGVVLDPDGNPVEGALVVAPLSSGVPDVDEEAWVLTDADGAFYLSGPRIRTRVLAYPPANRPGLAVGGPEPGGLRGLEWASGERHPTIEIELPAGRWIPATLNRVEPTEAEPVSFFVYGEPG